MIKPDNVVTFHYRLSDSDGNVLEDSHNGDAVVYLHGHKGMLKSLEEAMEGKNVGDAFSVTLPPEQAYGLRQENAQQRISNKHVLQSSRKNKYKPGMIVQVNTSEGPREVVVIKAGLKTIDVDTNHPFAGKTLTFDIKIVDIREASEEEIAHGHAHGVGGHQH